MKLDQYATRLAEILTDVAQPVVKGDYVAIRSTTLAEPLILALYEAVLRRGGHPFVWVELPQIDELFLEVATDEQLDFLDPLELALIQRIDKRFRIVAPFNTRELSQIATTRLQRNHAAYRPLIEYFWERSANGSLAWNVCTWPTQAAAQEAGMGLRAYDEFVYRAYGLDQGDPVGYWCALRERQQKLVEWLNGKSRLEARGPGVDLTMSVQERLWINAWGNFNLPDGEIFTGPVEDSVNGRIEFSHPSILGGQDVHGIKLTFENGVVVEASAEKGDDRLQSILQMDDGARRLGELGIGTNDGIQQFTGQTLFDEKIGGTIHLALGNSYRETNGVNQSAIHWDIVHDMKHGGEIWVDGELFYQNGQFVVEDIPA